MEEITLQRRVKLTTTRRRDHLEAFAADVEDGLTRAPKALPCRYFYDRRGSRLFDEICELPEYYLTRSEREILTRRVEELVALVPSDASVLELGSGSGVKTRILLEALLRENGTVRYTPIDISRSAVEQSSLDLVDAYEDLEIAGFVGEYREGLKRFGSEEGTSRLILWLGSSIGNLQRPDAISFLCELRRSALPRDRLLLGIDLRKDRDILEKAYDDARGVTARFNKNILARINSELGGDFDLEQFRHRARYEEDDGRIELHLVSEIPQRVSLDPLGLEIAFEEGEAIHTENSYKYSVDEIDELARGAGFDLVARWFDERRYFSVNLLAPG